LVNRDLAEEVEEDEDEAWWLWEGEMVGFRINSKIEAASSKLKSQSEDKSLTDTPLKSLVARNPLLINLSNV